PRGVSAGAGGLVAGAGRAGPFGTDGAAARKARLPGHFPAVGGRVADLRPCRRRPPPHAAPWHALWNTTPMPRHVIVTGATGFIGSHLSARLLGEGCRLSIVTRRPDSPSARWLASRGARVVAADLTDAESLLRAADDEPCEAVVH